jgi:hypothetical protein
MPRTLFGPGHLLLRLFSLQLAAGVSLPAQPFALPKVAHHITTRRLYSTSPDVQKTSTHPITSSSKVSSDGFLIKYWVSAGNKAVLSNPIVHPTATSGLGQDGINISADTSFQVVAVKKKGKSPPVSISKIPVIARLHGTEACVNYNAYGDTSVGLITTIVWAMIGPPDQPYLYYNPTITCSVPSLAGKLQHFPADRSDFDMVVNTPLDVGFGISISGATAYNLMNATHVDAVAFVDPTFEIDPSFAYAGDFELQYSPGYEVPDAGAGPHVDAALPQSGSNSADSFSFEFSHSSGYQNLSVVNILINNFLDGRQACYLAYVVSSSTLVLLNDAGDGGGNYAGSVSAGHPDTVIQNSQCAVSLASADTLGETLMLNLNIAFKPGFNGNRIQYLAARDTAGSNTGWQAMGVYQAPPAPSGVITVGTVDPARGVPAAGDGQPVTVTLTDTKGTGDIGVINVLVNDFIDGRRACYLAYVPASRQLLLVDDAGDAGGPFAGGMVLDGSAATIQNSQCAVNGAASSVSVAGNTLTLTLDMTFQSAFAGNRVVWVAGRDLAGGNNTGWQAVATLKVQ